MRLAKPHLDIGLFTNRREAQLAFWQQRVGLEFDHLGKLGRGLHQLRHHMNGSIMKVNHARDPLPELPPSGYRKLYIARPGDVEFSVARRRQLGQRIAGMVHLHDRAVHVVAQLVQAAAELAQMVEFQAHPLLPEGELRFPPVGEEADVEMRFGQAHAAILLPCWVGLNGARHVCYEYHSKRAWHHCGSCLSPWRRHVCGSRD